MRGCSHGREVNCRRPLWTGDGCRFVKDHAPATDGRFGSGFAQHVILPALAGHALPRKVAGSRAPLYGRMAASRSTFTATLTTQPSWPQHWHFSAWIDPGDLRPQRPLRSHRWIAGRRRGRSLSCQAVQRPRDPAPSAGCRAKPVVGQGHSLGRGRNGRNGRCTAPPSSEAAGRTLRVRVIVRVRACPCRSKAISIPTRRRASLARPSEGSAANPVRNAGSGASTQEVSLVPMHSTQ